MNLEDMVKYAKWNKSVKEWQTLYDTTSMRYITESYKHIKAESTMAVARDLSEGKIGCWYSMGIKFQLCVVIKFWRYSVHHFTCSQQYCIIQGWAKVGLQFIVHETVNSCIITY